MKKISLILGTLIAVATIACFLSTSAFAGKAADWPLGAAGYLKYEVIEGCVQAVDVQNDCFFIVENDILGDEPLYLGSNTMIYKGTEDTNLEVIHSAAVFTESDMLNFNVLRVGDRVKATYSFIGGRYVAETLCLIR
jgi:hypothetical protein